MLKSHFQALKKQIAISLGTALLSSSLLFAAPTIQLSKAELSNVGEQIYKNETGGKRDNLAVWNNGENFPSLGIGHFIWYKAGERAHFEETFPDLVAFLAQNGATLPAILKNNRTAPWKTQAAFNAAKSRGELNELMQFLEQHKDLQALFIYQRLQSALQKMKSASQFPDFIEMKFYEVAGSKNGLYALIDYVNFKGEGINTNERYKGQGWGLMQVLENMDLTHAGNNKAQIDAATLASFRAAADKVLTDRVNNADPAKGESRWLPGWKNRIKTYTP